MITVAEAVVKALEAEGVSVVFGYPGAAIAPFYDSLKGSAIGHVLVRQEQNAGHAASGYARISGRPGVVSVTSGPGACNLITALATAYMDSIPMVAITGQVSTSEIGRDVFQEADITGAAEPFTKYSFLVNEPNDIGRIMKEAFYIAASGRPGPVLVDLPVDIQGKRIDFHYPDTALIRGYKPTFAGNPPQVSRVAAAVREAKRPLICIGGGVLSAGAEKELAALSEKARLPMVSTMMGLSAVPSGHPLYFGMLGSYGTPLANRALCEADLLIVIGARLGDRALSSEAVLSRRAKIVHIDVDPAEIGKNVGTSIPLVGDAKNIITQLLGAITGAFTDEGWISELGQQKEKANSGAKLRKTGALDPREVIRALSLKLPENSVVVADVGQNQIWAARSMEFKSGRFLTSGGMGTMGYALPAAVGAAMADVGRTVVAIMGDGGFLMSMCELSTMLSEKLPIKTLVFNNRSLGMVREMQKQQYGGRYIGVELSNTPDIIKLSEAYSISAKRVEKQGEIEEAVAAMLSHEGPYILECVVEPDEPSL